MGLAKKTIKMSCTLEKKKSFLLISKFELQKNFSECFKIIYLKFATFSFNFFSRAQNFLSRHFKFSLETIAPIIWVFSRAGVKVIQEKHRQKVRRGYGYIYIDD